LREPGPQSTRLPGAHNQAKDSAPATGVEMNAAAWADRATPRRAQSRKGCSGLIWGRGVHGGFVKSAVDAPPEICTSGR
jgi:hypothetical protein